jgi:hypothetical protein
LKPGKIHQDPSTPVPIVLVLDLVLVLELIPSTAEDDDEDEYDARLQKRAPAESSAGALEMSETASETMAQWPSFPP